LIRTTTNHKKFDKGEFVALKKESKRARSRFISRSWIFIERRHSCTTCIWCCMAVRKPL